MGSDGGSATGMGRRIFVFEYLSAGGAGRDAALAAQGRAMRDALVADLQRIEGAAVDRAQAAPG